MPQKFDDPLIDDALLEATLVHARLLDEFLSGVSQRADNVKAERWVSGTTGFLGQERDPVNWQVAHMSSNRVGWRRGTFLASRSTAARRSTAS